MEIPIIADDGLANRYLVDTTVTGGLAEGLRHGLSLMPFIDGDKIPGTLGIWVGRVVAPMAHDALNYNFGDTKFGNFLNVPELRDYVWNPLVTAGMAYLFSKDPYVAGAGAVLTIIAEAITDAIAARVYMRSGTRSPTLTQDYQESADF